MKIENLDLGVRSYNSLLRAGITTTEQLQKMSQNDLEQIRYLNLKCIKEIREAMRRAEKQ